MICDVVFDLPLRQTFTYWVPPDMALDRGQRVSASLHGRSRVGVVVDVRDGDRARLLPIERAVESVPIVSAAMLELSRWAADESLTSWGSTLLALLPPPPRRPAEAVAPPPETHAGRVGSSELWIGASRESDAAALLAAEAGSALVIAPTREDAAAWASRLDAARLDSGVADPVRRASWFAAARGRARILVGNRAALLTPLPPAATLVLLDEHDPAHKPPGPPRIHARDLLRRRAQLDGSRLLLLSATPSAESWWDAERRNAIRDSADPPRPEVVTADTRRILRNHPLTLPLTRAIEETTRRGRRVALIVPRRAAGLVCPECGTLARCPDCGVPLALSRGTGTLVCRLCARAEPLPDRCRSCGGHKLSPLGWDPERVEAAVAKRFPRARVSRADLGADVVVGTPAMLRRIGPGSLGAAGIVELDSLLGLPDFRGGERAFQLVWSALEAVEPSGRLIVQTLHPEHYAVQSARERDRPGFYKQELRLREELGYPPFRRLCAVSVRARSDGEARARIAECVRVLDGIAGLTVYPAASIGSAGARSSRWRFLVKGPAELPHLLAPALAGHLQPRRRRGLVVEVEMDPE